MSQRRFNWLDPIRTLLGMPTERSSCCTPGRSLEGEPAKAEIEAPAGPAAPPRSGFLPLEAIEPAAEEASPREKSPSSCCG